MFYAKIKNDDIFSYLSLPIYQVFIWFFVILKKEEKKRALKINKLGNNNIKICPKKPSKMSNFFSPPHHVIIVNSSWNIVSENPNRALSLTPLRNITKMMLWKTTDVASFLGSRKSKIPSCPNSPIKSSLKSLQIKKLWRIFDLLKIIY